MGLKKEFYTVNGRVIGERPTGSPRVNYGTDTLGSVTATLFNGALQNTYLYAPFGKQVSRSGAGLDSSFRWVGSYGYRSSEASFAEIYVRARTYSQTYCRWTTVDAFWPKEPPYGYAAARPTSSIDPSGKKARFPHVFCYCIPGGKLEPDSEKEKALPEYIKRILRPYRACLLRHCITYGSRCSRAQTLPGDVCDTFLSACNINSAYTGKYDPCTPTSSVYWRECACVPKFMGDANESNCSETGQYQWQLGFPACRVECSIRVCCFEQQPLLTKAWIDWAAGVIACGKLYPLAESIYGTF